MAKPQQNSTIIVNRPTVINQPTINTQVTNITNNTTNVTANTANINQWFQTNTWQNRVTINSQNWNGRPWWYQPDYGDWHHGNWNGNYYFRGRDAWGHVDASEHYWLSGLSAWGLGNLIYRSGYQVYSNPYYVRQVRVGSTIIDYSRPICVQRSAYEMAYAQDEVKAQLLRSQALTYFDNARSAFFSGDTAGAYDNVNRAIALIPDDTSMHEFRALVLFAIERYTEAAEVMHAVLAVAPGWDWTTMSGLYSDHDIYLQQLRALEQYVRLNPLKPDARFLLAYHYITTGYPDNAQDQLRAALVLNPNDRLSADLLTLVTENNIVAGQDLSVEDVVVPATDLRGVWKARRPEGEIELELQEETFKWHFDFAGNDQLLRGKYDVSQQYLLFATEDGSQMAGTMNMTDRDHFTFRLLGASDSDPGLQFERR